MFERRESAKSLSFRTSNLLYQEASNNIYKKPIFNVSRPEQTYISLDQAIQYTGDNSTYSKRILYILSFIWISYGYLVMGISLFIGGKVSVFCFDEEINGFGECTSSSYCNSDLTIMLKPSTTIISEFKLICNKEYLIAWISSTIYLSNLFSSACFPYFIDKYGRKETLIVALLIACVGLALAALTWDFRLWMACIFVGGFAFGGVETTSRVYLSEISGPNFRINSNAVLSIVWALSQIALGILQLFVRYWRYIFIIFIAVPAFLGSLVAYFFLDESPRYLASVGALEACKEIIKKMTITNKRPPFQFKLLSELSLVNTKYVSNQKNELRQLTEMKISSDSFAVFRYLRPHLNILLIWCVYYFAYFGLQFAITSLKDVAFSFTFNGVAELFGVYLGSQILKKFNKAPMLKWQLALGAVACLFFTVARSDSSIWSFLIFIVKFDVTLLFQTLLICSLEAFPTKYRAQGFSYCFLFGRLSASAMPFILTLLQKWAHFTPMAVIGLLFVAGSLVSYNMVDANEFAPESDQKRKSNWN